MGRPSGDEKEGRNSMSVRQALHPQDHSSPAGSISPQVPITRPPCPFRSRVVRASTLVTPWEPRHPLFIPSILPQ